ncbi:hypothetical protein EJ05DRAFT_27315 [Pseudovirgaria hyperparasitica]|uniref:Uncharacterized protein n=1 Tax=Pseudovirgaria hyperparasitica TaxID=470096 RepID=A0A6A6WLR0_9PEZI|nr:uncharacterized protein EJ05DRAFT_27315 [Pseudovirgaria hyperparasitica]KAF2763137.1 hypothetical protein EJ05DRAFT_27315 [Pseudovirgaria hyperparasitica]
MLCYVVLDCAVVSWIWSLVLIISLSAAMELYFECQTEISKVARERKKGVSNYHTAQQHFRPFHTAFSCLVSSVDVRSVVAMVGLTHLRVAVYSVTYPTLSRRKRERQRKPRMPPVGCSYAAVSCAGCACLNQLRPHTPSHD